MQLPLNLSNPLPFWSKYVAYGILAVSLFGYGYVKGQDNVYEHQADNTAKVIYKQGKVTTKILTKYIKVKEKQDIKDEEIKHEGQAYAIKFPNDTYHFNNFYVRLHDASISGEVPSLSSGDLADTSGVSVSRQLEVAINNNIAGRQWKDRALLCEQWTKEQEELNE